MAALSAKACAIGTGPLSSQIEFGLFAPASAAAAWEAVPAPETVTAKMPTDIRQKRHRLGLCMYRAPTADHLCREYADFAMVGNGSSAAAGLCLKAISFRLGQVRGVRERSGFSDLVDQLLRQFGWFRPTA